MEKNLPWKTHSVTEKWPLLKTMLKMEQGAKEPLKLDRTNARCNLNAQYLHNEPYFTKLNMLRNRKKFSSSFKNFRLYFWGFINFKGGDDCLSFLFPLFSPPPSP